MFYIKPWKKFHVFTPVPSCFPYSFLNSGFFLGGAKAGVKGAWGDLGPGVDAEMSDPQNLFFENDAWKMMFLLGIRWKL